MHILVSKCWRSISKIFIPAERRNTDPTAFVIACNICLNIEPRHFVTNSSCEHSVCSDCFRRLPFDFSTRLRRCPLDRKLFTDIRYSTINVCVIPRPSPEELQTTHDPVLDDDEAEYERQRAEEERLNREAAQLLQDQMNNTGSNEPGKENDVPNLLYVKCVSTVSIQRFINFSILHNFVSAVATVNTW